MKYKVGDKVQVRKDLNDDDEYWMEDGSQVNHATEDMVKLKSRICTIKSTDNGQYKLEEDPNNWCWTDGMFEVFGRDWVWGGNKSTLKVKEMTTSHIKNSINILEKMNPDEMLEDGHLVKEWINTFNGELAYRRVTPFSYTLIEKDEEPKTTMEVEGLSWLREQLKERKYKENKEDIEMSNTDLIEHKLRKELDALCKAEEKETKDKFYETPIGKAAKAFNEALEKYGNEDQKDCDIDEDQLMELSEDTSDIRGEYDAKREEVKEYYAEALSLFLNADSYEQKVEILTAYGILKGPKVTKVKVEVK